MLLKRFLVLVFLVIAIMSLFDIAMTADNGILASIAVSVAFVTLVFAVFSLLMLLGRKKFYP
jgi:hypothetical protein